jgi:hypothetical protein
MVRRPDDLLTPRGMKQLGAQLEGVIIEGEGMTEQTVVRNVVRPASSDADADMAR